MISYTVNCIKKYAVFKGRASIKEYRYFGSLCHLLNITLLFFKTYYGYSIITALCAFFVLFSIIPYISLNVRRIHDINKSGWWFFASTFIPFAGLLLSFIILFFIKGNSGTNKYGEPPIN